MAKKTKAADLSIEEKLEQALIVPGYEPYKIPDNWCWTSVDSIAIIKNGYAFKSKQYVNSGIRIIRITNVQDGFVEDNNPVFYPFDKQKQLKDFLLKEDDLLISLTGNVGRVALLDKQYLPAALNQRVACIRFKSAHIYYKFAFYFMLQKKFSDDCFNNSKGSAQLNMSTEWLKQYSVPIPPFQEQHRIVERIESLFSKLDEAKEKAQEVIDSFETRKAAILHKAFSGELTAKWREENGVGIESWERKTLGEVCNSIFDGDHMPPPKSESGIPFLVISNVNDGYLSFENTRFVPQEYYDAITDTRKPEKGDVLYTLVGSFGIPVVVDTNAPFCFQRHMALLKPKSINTYFLWYLLQSQEMYQKASSIAKGVAQLTVPIKGLRLMDFNRPSEEEQIEIVRILDSLLEKEDTSKDNAESIIDQIETMKKAILAHAFRGELGTNDPEEESAVELLKRILTGE